MVGPDVSLGVIGLDGAMTMVGGAEYQIKHNANSINPPDSYNWHALYKSVFSWAITCVSSGQSNQPGAVLKIGISADGNIFHNWRAYMIASCLTTPIFSTIQRLYIPAPQVRFTLVNSSDALSLGVHGIIIQEAL